MERFLFLNIGDWLLLDLNIYPWEDPKHDHSHVYSDCNIWLDIVAGVDQEDDGLALHVACSHQVWSEEPCCMTHFRFQAMS